MTSLLSTFFGESGIHGFAYIAMRHLHVSERIFWAAVLICATYLSCSICWDEWMRFKTNPIVYAVEKDASNRMLPFIGFTMCSNYFDADEQKQTIQELWKVQEGDDKFDYYMEFLRTLSLVTYENLHILEPYQGDTILNHAPLLNLTLGIRASLPFKGDDGLVSDLFLTNREKLVRNAIHVDRFRYATVATEVGVCLSTTYLNEYQNPFGRYRMNVSNSETCRPMETCVLKINPFISDGSHLRFYFHNNEDLVTVDDRTTIKRDLKDGGTIDMNVGIISNSAVGQVRQLPIAYRKCRFPDENNLKYFKVYRPKLCRIECRINTALEMCNCKPFFYVIGNGRTCDIKGLLCLVKGNWSTTKCPGCFPLCEEVDYSEWRDTNYNYGHGSNFERMVFLTMHLPTLSVQRRVIFSYDQLIVAFGGAASFFLGCNFLSFVELFYFLIEFVCAKMTKFCKSHQMEMSPTV